jgi:hypothetical protein
MCSRSPLTRDDFTGTAERIVHDSLEKIGRIDCPINNAAVFIAKPFYEYAVEDDAAAVRVGHPSTNAADFADRTAEPLSLVRSASGISRPWPINPTTR